MKTLTSQENLRRKYLTMTSKERKEEERNLIANILYHNFQSDYPQARLTLASGYLRDYQVLQSVRKSLGE